LGMVLSQINPGIFKVSFSKKNKTLSQREI